MSSKISPLMRAKVAILHHLSHSAELHPHTFAKDQRLKPRIMDLAVLQLRAEGKIKLGGNYDSHEADGRTISRCYYVAVPKPEPVNAHNLAHVGYPAPKPVSCYSNDDLLDMLWQRGEIGNYPEM